MAGRIGPSDGAGGAGMAERFFRASATAGGRADAESQATRSNSLRIMVRNHQPRRFWFDGRAIFVQELGKKASDIGRGGVRATPGSAQLSPVSAIPVPVFRS